MPTLTRSIAVFALALSGCWSNGQEYEQVAYSPPPWTGPICNLAVSDLELPDEGGDAQKISVGAVVAHQDQSLLFEGRIQAPEADELANFVLVVYGPLPGGRRLAVTNALVTFEKDEDRWFKFRAECPPPQKGAMHCDVELAEPGGRVVARGELDIE